MRRAAVVGLVVAVAAACGGRQGGPRPASGGAGASPGGAGASPVGASSPPRALASPGASPNPAATAPGPGGGTSGGTPPGVAPSSLPGGTPGAGSRLRPGETRRISGELPLEVDVQPTCAVVGGAVRVSVRTEEEAAVAGVARYADDKAHGDYFVGEAKGGRFEATWTIKPEVPAGPASVLVSASASGNRGATVEAGFEVRAAGRCP